MRIRFNKRVRDSLADVMKTVATYGSLGFAFLLGEEMLKSERAWAFVVITAWYLVMQLLAHIILAFEDEEDAKGG
ncbi:MAG: hypothetical protein AzoDbin1_01866 [Azoarcus sp.]|nr:hypothetical protein [Azoarcus sp.]